MREYDDEPDALSTVIFLIIMHSVSASTPYRLRNAGTGPSLGEIGPLPSLC
jgi:hypothetical protein